MSKNIDTKYDEWMRDLENIRLLKPRHILFMCVANSARSQLAEGVARHFAPKNVTISSAGSRPTAIRLEAIEVLKEIGIDVGIQFSKSVEEIKSNTVDLVITLCAEEVCPAFLGKAVRLHWAFEDPAKVVGQKDRLKAFRKIRDELMKRLRILFE